ncbi:hypothetical protein ACNQR9_15495 [Mycolicibacterium peregrinum]|nr:hypothetical protein AWC21_31680 [Mycolicibacterium peregrinum]
MGLIYSLWVLSDESTDVQMRLDWGRLRPSYSFQVLLRNSFRHSLFDLKRIAVVERWLAFVKLYVGATG